MKAILYDVLLPKITILKHIKERFSIFVNIITLITLHDLIKTTDLEIAVLLGVYGECVDRRHGTLPPDLYSRQNLSHSWMYD